MKILPTNPRINNPSIIHNEATTKDFFFVFNIAVYPNPLAPAYIWATAHMNPVTVGSPIGY